MDATHNRIDLTGRDTSLQRRPTQSKLVAVRTEIGKLHDTKSNIYTTQFCVAMEIRTKMVHDL